MVVVARVVLVVGLTTGTLVVGSTDVTGGNDDGATTTPVVAGPAVEGTTVVEVPGSTSVEDGWPVDGGTVPDDTPSDRPATTVAETITAAPRIVPALRATSCTRTPWKTCPDSQATNLSAMGHRPHDRKQGADPGH